MLVLHASFDVQAGEPVLGVAKSAGENDDPLQKLGPALASVPAAIDVSKNARPLEQVLFRWATSGATALAQDLACGREVLTAFRDELLATQHEELVPV